jgi:hypothetical protein
MSWIAISRKIVLFLFIFCSLVSCIIIDLVDSSHELKYSRLIGVKITTLSNLWALGITNDQNYQGDADYILLTESNVTGPEIVTKNFVKKGLNLRVRKVLTTRLMFIHRVYFVVEEIGSNILSSNSIRIMLAGSVENQNFGLDDKLYTKQ